MSLRTELIRLFGINTWRQSQRLQPSEIDASAVHRAVGALLSVKGNPAQQVKLARAMCPETAAALCRWMAEPAFWGAVAGVTRQ